jgi:hypothetical protein
MRVYVPATLALAGRLAADGVLAAPVDAYAVTEVLRSWADASGPSDDEELELVALSEAARASLRLLAGDGGGSGTDARRVVLAADVPDGLVRVSDRSDVAAPGQVVVTSELPVAWLRAVHVDDAATKAEVGRAAGAVVAADAGDSAAEAVVAAVDSCELAWYAPEELPTLLA